MTVLVTKPAVNIREELADLKDQTTYDTVKSAGAVMDSDFGANGFMKRTGSGTYTVDTNTYLTEVTANDVNSGAATDGYVLTANGSGGAAWEVAASGGLSDGSTLTTGFTFNDNAIAKFGTGGTDLQLKSDGSDIQATLGTGINFYLNAPTSGAFYAVKEGSANNDVPVPARILNSYSLAAANGGGVGLDLASPNGNGIVKNAATLYARYNDVTNGAEDTKVEVYGYTAGTSGAMATIRGDQQSSFPSGITTTSEGDSSQWNTAYGWGNHASAGYASYADTTANFTNDLQQGGSAVVTQADVDDTPEDGVTTAPISSNWAYDHQAATAAHGVTGNIVGTTDTQTLTNKTITSPSISDPTLSGAITEQVVGLTGTSVALDPASGTIQTHTLSGNTTYTDGLNDGDSVTLMIDDGAGYAVTWPTITWKNNGGSAPTLATSGYTVVTLWKVGSTLYGAFVGSD